MRLTEAQYAELAAKGPGNITVVRAKDAPLLALSFWLPWPPTVNTYWRHTVRGGKPPKNGGKLKKAFTQVYISEQGQRYQRDVKYAVKIQQVPLRALRGRLAIDVVAHPPDNRVRDLDNLWKGMLDSLKNAGVILDDGDFDHECIDRGHIVPDGRIDLRLSEVSHEPEPLELAFETAFANEPEPRGLLREMHAKGEKSIVDKPPF